MTYEAVRNHYASIWGHPVRTATFRLGPASMNVLKWDAEANPEQVCLYATIGLSKHALSNVDSHRVELVVGLVREVDELARALAAAAFEAIQSHLDLGTGQAISFGEPLWPRTHMNSLLILKPQTEIVPALVIGDLHVQFLQAVPLFPSEVAFKAVNGVDCLLSHWQEQSVPFWDPDRTAEPPP